MELEARILWHSLKWLTFIKWPSSHEIDFGAFVIAFDFAEGVAEKVGLDGQKCAIAHFEPCSAEKGVLGIGGKITVGNHTIEVDLSEGESSLSRCVIASPDSGESEDELVEYREGQGRIFRYKNHISIRPRLVDGRVTLAVESDPTHMDLATMLTCFLVFNRYVEDEPPMGGERD